MSLMHMGTSIFCVANTSIVSTAKGREEKHGVKRKKLLML